MQTRKRAKPVKFGKKTPEKKEKEEPKAKKPEIEKITEKKEEKASVDIAKPKDTALAQPHEAEGVISNAIPSSVEPPADITAPPAVSPPDEPKEGVLPPQPPSATIENNSGVSVAVPVSSEKPVPVPPDIEEHAEDTETDKEQPNVDDHWPLTPKEEKKHGLLVYFFVVAIVAFLLGISFIAGAYYAMHGKGISLPHSIPGMQHASPTPQPVTPAPTIATKPSVAVTLSQYTINILNGSGVVGQAAKVKADLVTQGFNVTATGNADNANFTKTQISAKKSVSADYIQKLKEALQKKFVVEVESQVPNSSSQTTDVVITIGSSTSQ